MNQTSSVRVPLLYTTGRSQEMDFRRYGAAVGTLAILAVVITTATATASAAVHHEGDRWRDVIVMDANICGWPATFTSRGQFHLVDVTTRASRVSFSVHETTPGRL